MQPDMVPDISLEVVSKTERRRMLIEDITRREFMGAALAAALLVACGGDDDESVEPAAAEPATRSVTHTMGVSEIPTKPARIVTLWRPTLAAVTQLGFQPVGSVGDAGSPSSGLATYLPDGYAVDKLEIVGPNKGYDLEKIAALRPDLIIGALTSAGDEKDLYPRLSQIAPTVLLEWTGTTSWRQQLIDVAEVLGLRTKADSIVSDYKARAAQTKAAAGPAAADLSVSLVRVQGPGVLRLETPLSFPGSVIADIGFARPAVQSAPETAGSDFIQISLERIRDADGDMVFVFFNAANGQAWKEIQANPLWQGLAAQRNNRVYTFDYEWWGASNYLAAYRILSDVEKALKA